MASVVWLNNKGTTTVHKPQIRLTREQIIERMRSGERLRWVGGEICDRRPKVARYLFLGRDELDRDTSFLVVGMASSGVLRELTKNKNNKAAILNYELVE